MANDTKISPFKGLSEETIKNLKASKARFKEINDRIEMLEGLGVGMKVIKEKMAWAESVRKTLSGEVD